MPPTILVIIGITGDLSRRKLLPAIEEIVRANAVPGKFKIVGVTRQTVSVDDVLRTASGGTHDFLAKQLSMYQMDVTQAADYGGLSAYLQSIEADFGAPSQRLFYVSVPPQVAQPIVGLLGHTGLAAVPNTKLLLEKPFGTDLESAQELISQTTRYFTEDQVYRIDHYLAKEMAQNLIVFRGSNTLFRRTWNNDFIESVEIIATEDIRIEGRSSFYEQTGALRDIVQSHLLQLAALTLMATPHVGQLSEVPGARLAALRQLRLPQDKPLSTAVHRGQYNGYRKEVDNAHSVVETYVDLTLESTDPAWAGVPIRLITGKALAQKATQICITYKKDEGNESNLLVITLQPNEGVQLCLWAKVPGYEWRVEQHAMSMAFKDYFAAMPEAYEQVLVDAMQSDHTLFTGSDEVLETWRILQPIQKAWAMSDATDLSIYKPGSQPYMER
jgi:glucose-6-phosphate 1-dehydrogenase